MTRNANSDNIEPKLREIAPMMIFLCLGGAVMALQGISFWQFAIPDSVSNSIVSFLAFRVSGVEFFTIISLIDYTFFASSITFYSGLAFIALKITFISGFALFALLITFYVIFAFFASSVFRVIFSLADFTIARMPLFPRTVFVKICNWFDSLASGTSFGYNWFGHGFSPLQKSSCLEPFIRPVRMCGSLYYIRNNEGVNF